MIKSGNICKTPSRRLDRRWLLTLIIAICLVTSAASLPATFDALTGATIETPTLAGPKDDHCG